MKAAHARRGALLVTILAFAAAVWVLVAGTLVTVRLRHDVAVAALHHARARVVALHVAERSDAHDWWADGAASVEVSSGAVGQCAWTVYRLEQTSSATRYEVRATYLRAEVVLDGTSFR